MHVANILLQTDIMQNSGIWFLLVRRKMSIEEVWSREASGSNIQPRQILHDLFACARFGPFAPPSSTASCHGSCAFEEKAHEMQLEAQKFSCEMSSDCDRCKFAEDGQVLSP